MSAKAYEEKVEVNPDSNVHRHVVNLSDALSLIDYDKAKKNIFYMIKYARDGFFVTVIRTIPPDAGNNVSAWIYIPYAADISDRQIDDIVGDVTAKVSAPNIDKKDIADLRHAFAKEYDDLPDALVFDASGKGGYAFRNYGTGTHVSISDLIGPYRFQKSYLPFSGVFLVDADVTSTTDLPILTNTPLVSMQSLLAPPEPEHTPVPMSKDVPARKKTYHFQIPAKSAAIGTVIEFEITTASDLADSPIDGYEPTADIQEGAGRSNHLLYKAENATKKILDRAIYAVAGCLVGVIVTLLCTCDRNAAADDSAEPAPTPDAVVTVVPDSTTQKADTTAAAPAAQDMAIQDTSLEAAIKYLDANKTWEKSKMESYPDLKGLYDDMNTIQRKRLVDYWGPKLKESRTFSTLVVHHARLSYKKTARLKQGQSTFNPDDKSEIFIQSYLNCIDP